MIRTVLFDLMGTLLVRAPGSAADPADHFYRVLQEAGNALGRDEFWRAGGTDQPAALALVMLARVRPHSCLDDIMRSELTSAQNDRRHADGHTAGGDNRPAGFCVLG